MAITDRSKEGIWLRRLYEETKACIKRIPQRILVGNNGAIELTQNQRNTDRSKHIDIKHHFMREAVDSKFIELKCVESSQNTVDILTKALSVELHRHHMKGLGLGQPRTGQGDSDKPLQKPITSGGVNI